MESSILAQALERDLPTCRGALPSVRDLCVHYGASRRAMQRAVGVLIGRGLLRFERGRRLRIVGDSRPDATVYTPVNETAPVRIERLLQEEIEAGHFRRGYALPKVSLLASGYGTSVNSVCAALVALRQKGAIHKKGKCHVVGPPPGTLPNRQERPTILVLTLGDTHWKGLVGPRTLDFLHAFVKESEQCRFQLHAVHTKAKYHLGRNVVGGVNHIVELVAGMGSRYRGMLITCTPEEFPDAPHLARQLKRISPEPIVWFDRHGRTGGHTSAVSLATSVFRVSEERAAQTAVDHIASCGHRNVALVYKGDADWELLRKAQVVDAAQHRGLVLESYSISEESSKAGPDVLNTLLRSGVARSIVPGFREVIDAALAANRENPVSALSGYVLPDKGRRNVVDLRLTPALIAILARSTITALIIANDQLAISIYRWACAARIEIPNTLSLVSFDNYLSTLAYPIDSVDFGFGRLGYRAFHEIAQDLPLTKRNTRVVESEPYVIERGSVAEPRGLPLEVRRKFQSALRCRRPWHRTGRT